MRYYILLFLLGVMLTGCAANPASQIVPQDELPVTSASMAEYRKITAEQAMERMNEAAPWILLDVRTEEEFNEEHIEGAILIPDHEISSRIESEIPDKDIIIFVYCRSGRRSANAAYEMVNMGYTNVYDFGGIIDWPYDVMQQHDVTVTGRIEESK